MYGSKHAFAMTVVISLGMAIGCAQRQASSPPTMLASNPHGQYSAAWPDLGADEERYITFDMGDSFQTCRRISPKFPFDSARTRAQDHLQLRAFASCMNHPVMLERTVLLVGRADDRGSAAYNRDLGKRRAERIKQLLVDDGLNAARIEVKSRGESQAEGAGPDISYGYDRRVDVVIRGGVHAPGPPKS